MGQYQRDSSSWTSALSNDLSEAYAKYINELGLENSGEKLTLEEDEKGIFTGGSYYDFILETINTSLNNYLADNYSSVDDMQSYIDELNSESKWVSFDSDTKTATISSIEDFVNNCKSAQKSVGAFDDLERSQAENAVFGNSDTDSLHFDSIMADLLNENGDEYSQYSDYQDYSSEYSKDLTLLDSLGNDTYYRQNMYNPMYYLSDYYDGYGTSDVAKYWRIRTGINQTDTALTVEANLALALTGVEGVDVDFETVWGQGHTMAERTGNSTENMINWINECLND